MIMLSTIPRAFADAICGAQELQPKVRQSHKAAPVGVKTGASRLLVVCGKAPNLQTGGWSLEKNG